MTLYGNARPSLTCAVEEARLGEDDEGARVAGENAAEEDVTQLPAGRHDDRGPEEEGDRRAGLTGGK